MFGFQIPRRVPEWYCIVEFGLAGYLNSPSVLLITENWLFLMFFPCLSSMPRSSVRPTE